MTDIKDSGLLTRGKRRGKRVLTCAETLSRTGQNPFENLVRLAVKAERAKDFGTAAANWRYLGDFIDAKRKPIDPTEIKDLEKRAVTLEELQKIKTAILAGTAQVIEEHTLIEHSPNVQDAVISGADDLV